MSNFKDEVENIHEQLKALVIKVEKTDNHKLTGKLKKAFEYTLAAALHVMTEEMCRPKLTRREK